MAQSRLCMRAVSALALLAPMAAGCAGTSAQERAAYPDWFKGRLAQADRGDYPDLREVPKEIEPGRPAEEWDAIEKDLRAAGRDLATSERNVAADLEAGLAAGEAAREELETPRAEP